MFSLFEKKVVEDFVIFDITPTSVAGGYVSIAPSRPPIFFYTKRISLKEGNEDTHEERLSEAFGTLSKALLEEGASRFYKATRRKRVPSELMSVGYPWQETKIRTKTFERSEPFFFTEEMRDYALREILPEEGMKLTGRFLLATLLNGYHIQNPLGKKVRRADLLMLTTEVQKKITETLSRLSRKHFHTGTPHILAQTPLIYFAAKDMFPHEEEMLIMNVTEGITNIAIVKKHLLVDVVHVPMGTEIYKEKQTNDVFLDTTDTLQQENAWVEALSIAFRDCASREALPRTVLLVAAEMHQQPLKRLLDSTAIRSIWLSNTTLRILPISERHLSSFVRVDGDTQQDVALSLLALYYTVHKELVP